MAIRTREQFFAGLRDGRRVFYRGRRVPDVLGEPELHKAASRSAIAYDMQHDPAHRALAVDEGDGEPCSAMFRVPRSADDLLRRSELIERTSAQGGATIVLKEVGTDGLLALLRVLEGEALERATAFFERCRLGDLALAVAQTDVKGDRSRLPHEQSDPDMYLRIVDEDRDAIVVRGAKCHTSFSAYVDEILVLPTRAMRAEDESHAVAFALPVDTPGLELYVSPYLGGERNHFEHPLSSRYSIVESLTVFDDVVVPKERVFLARRPELAGPLAVAFVDFHRFTAVSYKLPLVDLIVGAAHLAAEVNGTGRAGHVRDKIAQLVRWAETVRGLAQLSALRSAPDASGVQVPDALTVNMAKFEFAHGYHAAIGKLIDLAGGLLVTGPGLEDWQDPATRARLEKYYAAAVPAERRLGVMNLIADLCARDFGGYQSVLATHAEGSLEAEKLQLLRSYAPGPARALAERLGRIAP